MVAQVIKYEVWYGDWSLGTDTCVQWIEGFNDGYTPPPANCLWQQCPQTYMPAPYNTDFDRNAPILGPNGGGWPDMTLIHQGQCVHDSSTFSDTQVASLAKCAMDNFHKYINASFFLNFKTEQGQAKWDYSIAWNKGWLNQTSAVQENIQL